MRHPRNSLLPALDTERRLCTKWFGRALLSFTLCIVLSACKVPLYSGLGEKEANQIVGKLLEYDIDVVKQAGDDNQVTLLVDEAQFGQAVNLLNGFGLPRPRYETMGEVFSGDGLVTSPVQEWARFNFALSQELSNTVSTIPGVVSAEVHIANPRKETPFEEAPPPSASVLALVERGSITAELVPQIKQLVAYSVENVEYERVGVVISPVDLPAQPEFELVSLGGVIMRESSMSWALVLVIGIAVLGSALGAGATFAAEAFLKSRGNKE